jgi:hypothetical protein
MKRGIKLLAGLVLVGVLLSATGIAWAEGSTERGALRGQVVAVEGDTLLVNTLSGQERSVVVGEDTRLRIPGVREPSIEDIEVGDYVGAWGEIDEGGDLLATVVGVIPSEIAQRRWVVQGHVTAMEGQTLTVETRQGERIVVTDDSTHFRIVGVEDPGLEDVSVGDPILALGRPDEEGNLLARAVAIVTPGQVRRHTIRGVIEGIEGNTISLLTGQGEVRVETDRETTFRIPGVEEPGLDDLEEKDLILVVGAWEVDGEDFNARAVRLIPRWPSHLRFLRGEVTGIEGRTIVLNALQGEVAVLTDGDTRFRIPGVEEPGLDDLRIGDKVGILVARDEDGGLLAKVVLVRRPDESLAEAIAAPVEAAAAYLDSFVQQVSDIRGSEEAGVAS